jgi:hypothetical protein
MYKQALARQMQYNHCKNLPYEKDHCIKPGHHPAFLFSLTGFSAFLICLTGYYENLLQLQV